MNNQAYMHHLRHRVPNHPDYHPESRGVALPNGATELITLPKSTWDYADWLEARTPIRMTDWVAEAKALSNPTYTLSHIIWYWLYHNECDRFRAGEGTPNPCPPQGYQGWGQ